jgi:hypothetical protein
MSRARLRACSASILALVVVTACSGSSTGSGDGDGGTSGGVSSTKLKTCPSSALARCSQDEIDAYYNCQLDKCDAAYQTCFGAGYRDANFGGPCGTFIACTQKCDCGDAACQKACGAPPADCSSCTRDSIAPCIQASCGVPDCAK